MNEGREGPLTLISAPAGFGKTSLLASWLAAEPLDVAWLAPRRRLGEASFWVEWLTAIQRVVPPRSALSRITPPRAGTPPGFVLQLLNGFTQLEEPIVVVIDDFHTVHSLEIAATFDELLRAAPASLRLVLSTRHDPMLPLHLLRASGELTELRARDLAFTPDEARALLDDLGVRVDSQAFTTLLVRTEGWAAGLRLFMLSCRTGDADPTVLESLAFDERPASEYLLAEVLRRQPDDVRDFLLATAVAERFTPDLADAMTRPHRQRARGRAPRGREPLHRPHRDAAALVPLPQPFRRAAARRAPAHGARLDPGAARARGAVALRARHADGSRAACAGRG